MVTARENWMVTARENWMVTETAVPWLVWMIKPIQHTALPVSSARPLCRTKAWVPGRLIRPPVNGPVIDGIQLGSAAAF